MVTNSAMLLYKNYKNLPAFCMKETDNEQPDQVVIMTTNFIAS